MAFVQIERLKRRPSSLCLSSEATRVERLKVYLSRLTIPMKTRDHQGQLQQPKRCSRDLELQFDIQTSVRVSVHRVQLLLQVLSVKRFHHQQQQQQSQANAQEELAPTEISEICDYFSRRVASEPYDASRVASFITLLTLPISILREFLKLIAWKKGLAQAQGGDIAPAQKPRIELCLENHSGSSIDENNEISSVAKSNIHYDRLHNSVDFGLTVVLDSAHIPHINAAGGAAWLPYCVSVRLRFSFGENPHVSFQGMEGSHGGRACWLQREDWERCKQKVARTVEMSGNSAGDSTQGRLRGVADSAQRILQLCLQGMRDGSGVTANSGAT